MDSKKKGKTYQIITKSNDFILSHFDFTALEQKLLVASIVKLRETYGDYGNILKLEDISKPLSVDMTVGELKEFFGRNGNGIYTELREAADSLTARRIETIGKSKKDFEFTVPFPKAKCKDGIFSLTIGSDVLKGIANLEGGSFTQLQIPVYKALKNQYAIRLYEILSSYLFRTEVVEYDLTELKKQLGVLVVYSDIKGNANEMDKYPIWADFKRYALEKAVKEINLNTDLNVSFQTRKKHSGRSYDTIIFTVGRKSDIAAGDEARSISKKAKKNEEPDMAENAANLYSFFEEEDKKIFSEHDVFIFLMVAGGDETAVMKQYQNFRIAITKGDIANPTGWMISAITQNYASETTAKKRPAKAAKKTDFPERNYSQEDYLNLEERLLKK